MGLPRGRRSGVYAYPSRRSVGATSGRIRSIAASFCSRHFSGRGAVSVVRFPFNPLDAVGWKGDLAPVRLNVADIRPMMSHRYHLPPSVHSTFVADRFVVFA